MFFRMRVYVEQINQVLACNRNVQQINNNNYTKEIKKEEIKSHEQIDLKVRHKKTI